MEKIILTRGRWEQSYAIKHIPKQLLKQITICCHQGEAKHYNRLYPNAFKEVKEYVGNNVAEARHWSIVNSSADSVLFIEDNINLLVRGYETELGKPNKNKLYKITPDHFREETRYKLFVRMFLEIEGKLSHKDYGLVGLSARGGNGHVEEDFQDNCRMYGCWAIKVKAYNSMTEKLTDVKFREDFYIMLSLIKNNYKIGCYFKYAMEKVKGIGTPGGCSNYRTQDLTDANAMWMAKEFHPFVKAVSRERKWEGYTGITWDIRVQWKKMYEYYKNKTDSNDLFAGQF